MGFNIQNLGPNAQLTVPRTDFPSIHFSTTQNALWNAPFWPTNHVFPISTAHAHSVSSCI